MIIWLFSSSLGYYNIWFLSFLSNLKVSLCFVNLLHSLCKVVFFLDGFFKRNSFSFINCSFPFFLFMEFEFFSIFRKRSIICIYWFFGWVIFWSFELSNLPAFDLFFAHPSRLSVETELSSPSTYISAIFSIPLRFSHSCHWRFCLILRIEDF